MTFITIEAILPDKEIIDMPEMQKQIKRVLRRTARRVEGDYKRTTDTWKKRPDFDTILNEYEAIIGTDNIIYIYVERGTRPHPIRAVRAPRLIFNTQFAPKTQPGQLKSSPGFSGPPVASKLEVQHPGTEARDFTKVIAKKTQPQFQRDLEKAIKKAVR